MKIVKICPKCGGKKGKTLHWIIDFDQYPHIWCCTEITDYTSLCKLFGEKNVYASEFTAKMVFKEMIETKIASLRREINIFEKTPIE